MVLATFLDLVQETSSAWLMDDFNWNHNDKKGLFFFFKQMVRSQRGSRDQWLPADRMKEWALFRCIRHKVPIMTGFSQDKSYFIGFQTLLWMKKQLWTEHVLNLQGCAAA